ncbi:MAG: GIY-YIG nuclease family protein [Allosphingosinicella sp.]
MKTGPGSRRGGGPRLDSDEWAVLLDIYLRNRGTPVGVSHPELRDASKHLSLRAQERGRAREGAVLRSSHGLARRLTVLRAIERGDAARAPREARLTWDRFAKDPEACAAAAAAIRLGLPEAEGERNRPSRGPAPFVGQYMVEQVDGAANVYVMALGGSLVTGRGRGAGKPYLKIGRSMDSRRREDELNQAFPPGLGLRWKCLFTRTFSSGQAAHEVEQSVLTALAGRGACIGGEFLRCTPSEVSRLIRAEARRLGHKCLPAAAGDAREGEQGASRVPE